MGKLFKLISISLLTIILLLSFSACGSNDEQTYFDNITDLYSSINDEASSLSVIDTSTEDGYNNMVDGVENVYKSILELSELETPDKYSEVQKLFSSSAEKIKESVDLFRAVDLESEEAYTKYSEAYDVYYEGAELFQDAGEKLESINNE